MDTHAQPICLFRMNSQPPNTVALRMGEKAAVLENGGKGSHLYNQEKTYIQDLKIIRGMGVWGGGGQRRGSIGGTTVTTF